MSVELVVLDCDGVLVDSERLTVGVEARVLTDLGFPHTADEVVARFMGRSSAAQLAELEAELGPEKSKLFDERSTAEVLAAFDRELTPVDGVEELLGLLESAGLETCVASSGTHGRIRRTLGLTGLYDRFEGRIFSATEVELGKPAPDLFLHAAEQMGIRPSHSVVVEDSVYGVLAAVSAGMTAYGYAGGLTAESTLADAGAVVFHDMRELFGMLDHSPSNRA